MTLELLAQKNPFVLAVIGNFNDKYSNYIQIALHQIINEPTHILPNSSSCIDLIFTSQPNMVIKSVFNQNMVFILRFIQVVIISLFFKI